VKEKKTGAEALGTENGCFTFSPSPASACFFPNPHLSQGVTVGGLCRAERYNRVLKHVMKCNSIATASQTCTIHFTECDCFQDQCVLLNPSCLICLFG